MRMDRRFVRRPRRWAVVLAVILAVLLAVILTALSTGCAASLDPPGGTTPTDPPTSVEEDVTLPTGPGLGTFRPELGSPPIDPLQVWANVAKELDFAPAVGMTFGVDLDYHVSGAVQWFFVQATTGDGREVRVVWPEQQGDSLSAHAFVETTPTSAIDTNPPYPYTVYSVLSALGAVGPGNIFARLPAPGDSGHYGMSFPTDVGYMQAYGLTGESPAYLWDGRAFQTADLGDAKYAQQDLYLCITAGSMVFVPEDQRWKPGPESMATTSAYESAGLSYFLIPIDQDAARVEDYFGKAGYLEGITVKDIQLSDDAQGRTLSLTFAGDGSEQAAELFSNLYYGSTSDDGWPAQLNKAGLGLARIRMTFDWGDGTAPEAIGRRHRPPQRGRVHPDTFRTADHGAHAERRHATASHRERRHGRYHRPGGPLP